MAIRLEPILQEFKVENKIALAGIGAVTAALAAVAATSVLAVKGTFDWAKELDSIQDVMGVTSKEAAALNFVLRKSGTDTETLTQGMVILEKSLFKTNGELDTAGEKLQEYGISAKDANGNIKDQATLVDEISKKYNSLGTQTERVNLLTELFGRSGANLIDVFDTLAKEGGLDKTTDKVEKLGLAIDPQKYENFTRNLEEIKLAFLGVAITVVDNLMPAVEGFTNWWESDGLPAFQAMVKWLGTNVPIAIKDAQRAWTGLTSYWQTNVNPIGQETNRLLNNLDTILRRLSGESLAQFALRTIMTIPPIQSLMAVLANLTPFLNFVRQSLDLLNDILEAGINAWNRYTGAARSAANIPAPSAAPSVPTSTGTTGGGARRRAVGGSVMPGNRYNINERMTKSEVLIPDRVGSMAKSIDVNVKFTDRELDRIGVAVARSMKPVLQRALA